MNFADYPNLTVEDHAPIYWMYHKDGTERALWTTDMKLLAERLQIFNDEGGL